MKESRPKALTELFALEGFKSNIDSPTIYGWDSKWWPTIYATLDTLLKAGRADAARKYAEDNYIIHFWQPLQCDDLPYPLDCDAFIEAINDGEHGIMVALKTCKTADEFLAWCDQHYRDIVASKPEYARFLQGWLNRTARLKHDFAFDNLSTETDK